MSRVQRARTTRDVWSRGEESAKRERDYDSHEGYDRSRQQQKHHATSLVALDVLLLETREAVGSSRVRHPVILGDLAVGLARSSSIREHLERLGVELVASDGVLEPIVHEPGVFRWVVRLGGLLLSRDGRGS